MFAAPPPGYYQAAEGKIGESLRLALHLAIRDHKSFPYSTGNTNTSHVLKQIDEDPFTTNNVILIYERRSEPKSTFGLTSGWNREHLWPNSYGLNGKVPSYSDVFNLKPADHNVNSARGNKYYDISDPASPGYKKPAHAEAPLCSTTTVSWEPPDEVKGDIARSLFYMDVRYEGTRTNEPNLVLTENVALISSTNIYMGRLSTLLRWHYEDPVDETERRRNDAIFEFFQGNRNPFIDRPEWVTAVFEPHRLPPLISILPENDNIVLSWPGIHTNAVLECATSLPGTWHEISTPRTFTNDQWTVIHPAGKDACLFRLRLP